MKYIDSRKHGRLKLCFDHVTYFVSVTIVHASPRGRVRYQCHAKLQFLILFINIFTDRLIILNVVNQQSFFFLNSQKYESPNRSSEHHQPSPLESKDFVKYLGVFIDYKLSWNHHIDTVTLKISRTIGLLSKLRHFIPPYTLLQIYNSLVAPYLRYGLIAWGQANKTLLNKLLILQKRALRFIFFSDRCEHAIPLFLSAKILPVQFMYFYQTACMMHDVSNNVVPLNIKNLFQLTSSVHRYNTRSSTSQNYYLKRCNLEIQRKSFSRIGAKLWNEIPASIRNLPKHLFKKELRSVLLKILETADDYLDIESIFPSFTSSLVLFSPLI